MIDLNNKDIALAPLMVDHHPDSGYAQSKRLWQGVPTLELTSNNRKSRMWLSIMAGDTEMAYTYVATQISDDDGISWSEPVFAVDGSAEGLRIFDQVLWTDPSGRLWFFWSQMYGHGDGDGRVGCWEIHCDRPLDSRPQWTKARRIANGVMRNKPTVRNDGVWLLPVALWHNRMRRDLNWLPREEFSNVYASTDDGNSFYLLGYADVENRDADEHMVVELSNGRLWMLVRTKYGIGQAFSDDGGRSWQDCGDSGIWGPTSRFFIRKLRNGHLLLVNNTQSSLAPQAQKLRTNLTATISRDDGKTWEGGLLLDERPNVSYPDGFENDDGRLFIAYDRERDTEREVLTASFTEEEVLRKALANPDSYIKRIASKGKSHQ